MNQIVGIKWCPKCKDYTFSENLICSECGKKVGVSKDVKIQSELFVAIEKEKNESKH